MRPVSAITWTETVSSSTLDLLRDDSAEPCLTHALLIVVVVAAAEIMALPPFLVPTEERVDGLDRVGSSIERLLRVLETFKVLDVSFEMVSVR